MWGDVFTGKAVERVLVLMGSGAETARETVEYLNRRGDRVGILAVRLYRPFSIRDFVAALPITARRLVSGSSQIVTPPLYRQRMRNERVDFHDLSGRLARMLGR